MTDRPILFSGPMIRAIIEGRKSVTRRVLKPQPFGGGYHEGEVSLDRVWDGRARFSAEAVGGGAFVECTVRLPYAVGDRLWVREAHAFVERPNDWGCSGEGAETVVYRASADDEGERWLPGIYMPRWASRLTLHITDVRVERVQEISEVDAIREGVTLIEETCDRPRDAFRALWDSLNAARGFGWDANPWVVAISFEVERANIDAARRAA